MLKLLVSITPDVIKAINSEVIPNGLHNVTILSKLLTNGKSINDSLVAANVNESFINMEVLNSTNDIQSAIDIESKNITECNYYALGNNPIISNGNIITNGRDIRQYNAKTSVVDFSEVDKQEYVEAQKDNGYNYVEVMSMDLAMCKILPLDEITNCPYCKSQVIMTPLKNNVPRTNENIMCIVMNGSIVQMNSDFDSHSDLDKYNITIPELAWEDVHNFMSKAILPTIENGIVILDVIRNKTHYGLDLAQFKSLTEIDDDLGFIKFDCITKNLVKILTPEVEVKECGHAQIQKDLSEYNERVNQGLIEPFKLPDNLIEKTVELVDQQLGIENETQTENVYDPNLYENLPGLNEDKIKMLLSRSNVPESIFENFTKPVRETFLKRNLMYVNDQDNDHDLLNNNVHDSISETPQEFSDSESDQDTNVNDVQQGVRHFADISKEKENLKEEDSLNGEASNSKAISYNYVNLTQEEWDKATYLFRSIINELGLNTSSTLYYTLYKGGLATIVKLFNQMNIESIFGVLKYQRYDGSDTEVELLSPPKIKGIHDEYDDIVIIEDLVDSGITLLKTLDYLSKIYNIETKRISIFCIHASGEAILQLNNSRFNVNLFYYNLKQKNDWITYPWE